MQLKQLSVDEFTKELHDHFERRKTKSKSYSVRAMAMEMKVPASTLAKVLNGERKLGLRVAREMAVRFNVEIVEEPRRKRTSALSKFGFKQIDPKSRTKVDFINLAILELLKLRDFEPSTAWIARRLGLDVSTTREILDQMEEAGMLAREANGWRDLLEESSVHAEQMLTTDVIRTSLKRALEISSASIETIPYDKREHSFAIFPTSSRDLPKLKKKLLEMSWDFSTKAQKSKNPKDNLYVLQLGFFPVTR